MSSVGWWLPKAYPWPRSLFENVNVCIQLLTHISTWYLPDISKVICAKANSCSVPLTQILSSHSFPISVNGTSPRLAVKSGIWESFLALPSHSYSTSSPSTSPVYSPSKMCSELLSFFHLHFHHLQLGLPCLSRDLLLVFQLVFLLSHHLPPRNSQRDIRKLHQIMSSPSLKPLGGIWGS